MAFIFLKGGLIMKINRIILPVLKDIRNTDISNENDTLESIIPKFKEEVAEFIEAIEDNHDIDHKLEEYFDVVQCMVRYGRVLERMGVNLEGASIKHYEKLLSRNWNVSDFVDVFFSVSDD